MTDAKVVGASVLESRRAARILAVAVAALAGGGCHLIKRGTMVQPNPLRHPTETLRDSMPITIVTGDMALNVPRRAIAAGANFMVTDPYPLRNVATFTVVSRNRLRFHVQIEHKWREWADPTSWHAHLIVDRARRYTPEEADLISNRMLTMMWDREERSVARDSFGDPIYVYHDAYKRRQPLGSLAVFRGRGDFVFYGRNIFTPAVRSLTLVLERSELSFSFTWKFRDGGIAAAGRGRVSVPARVYASARALR